MKRLSGLLAVLTLAAMLLSPGVTAAHTEDAPLSVNLLVGGTRDIGDVKVWNDAETLYVRYLSSTAACFQATHLAVVTDLADIPRNSRGRPIPGRFKYSDTHGCVQEYTYEISLAENDWTVDTLLYIAAQAVTAAGNAWAEGDPIPRMECETCPDGCDAYFTYTVQCSSETVRVDFGDVDLGTSVEGLGVVHGYLNIDARSGTAVKIAEKQLPRMYGSGNQGCDNHTTKMGNGGLASGGGFSDQAARQAKEPHWYRFTFAPGVTVSAFSLHMLDFGDFNPSWSKDHYTAMIAYDANGNEVARQELAYQSDGKGSPRSSDYGDLMCKTGDAIYAAQGDPGNWTWRVEGTGIARVELVFDKEFDPDTGDGYDGDGFDPYIGFDSLAFTIECPR
jgi:hypothetical protein